MEDMMELEMGGQTDGSHDARHTQSGSCFFSLADAQREREREREKAKVVGFDDFVTGIPIAITSVRAPYLYA